MPAKRKPLSEDQLHEASGIRVWWRDVVADSRFQDVRASVMRRRPFRGVQISEHQQHYAGGHCAGVEWTFDILESLLEAFDIETRAGYTEEPDFKT